MIPGATHRHRCFLAFRPVDRVNLLRVMGRYDINRYITLFCIDALKVGTRIADQARSGHRNRVSPIACSSSIETSPAGYFPMPGLLPASIPDHAFCEVLCTSRRPGGCVSRNRIMPAPFYNDPGVAMKTMDRAPGSFADFSLGAVRWAHE